jgi:hypothetical protein
MTAIDYVRAFVLFAIVCVVVRIACVEIRESFRKGLASAPAEAGDVFLVNDTFYMRLERMTHAGVRGYWRADFQVLTYPPESMLLVLEGDFFRGVPFLVEGEPHVLRKLPYMTYSERFARIVPWAARDRRSDG